MNLLVTGAAGFIGSHFVLRHVRKFPKDGIVVLDAMTYAADPTVLEPVRGAITFVKGDIADIDAVEALVKENDIDVIVNFAAETHVDNSIKNAVPFLHSNVIGVQSLIEVCKRHPKLKLLHISTDEVFGDIADGERSREVGDPMFPSSPYAASKAAAEMFIMAAMRTFGIKAAISRCTNNYGPHQASEKFLPTMIRAALADKPLPLYGKGLNKRDWLYVTDHTDAIELILKTEWAFFDPQVPGVHPSQPHGSGHIFQISADDERENITVAKEVLKALGKPESLISFVKDRPGHDWRYALDSSSVRNLGWKPQVSFEEGLREVIAWFQLKNEGPK